MQTQTMVFHLVKILNRHQIFYDTIQHFSVSYEMNLIDIFLKTVLTS
jgi:hypothetical protein